MCITMATLVSALQYTQSVARLSAEPYIQKAELVNSESSDVPLSLAEPDVMLL